MSLRSRLERAERLLGPPPPPSNVWDSLTRGTKLREVVWLMQFVEEARKVGGVEHLDADRLATGKQLVEVLKQRAGVKSPRDLLDRIEDLEDSLDRQSRDSGPLLRVGNAHLQLEGFREARWTP